MANTEFSFDLDPFRPTSERAMGADEAREIPVTRRAPNFWEFRCAAEKPSADVVVDLAGEHGLNNTTLPSVGLRFVYHSGRGRPASKSPLQRHLEKLEADFVTSGHKVVRAVQFECNRRLRVIHSAERRKLVLQLARDHAHRGRDLNSFIAKKLGLTSTRVRQIRRQEHGNVL